MVTFGCILGCILGSKINRKSNRILSAILGRIFGGPGAPQWSKSLIFIEMVGQNRRSPFASRGRFPMDLGAILEQFWAHFWSVFSLFFQGVFRSALLEPKKQIIDPTGTILGAPGRGKGRGKPPPQRKNVKMFCVIFVVVFFLLLC